VFEKRLQIVPSNHRASLMCLGLHNGSVDANTIVNKPSILMMSPERLNVQLDVLGHYYFHTKMCKSNSVDSSIIMLDAHLNAACVRALALTQKHILCPFQA